MALFSTPLAVSFRKIYDPLDTIFFVAKIILIQGLMSAMSAGMLIYAACVEMLAGDFVMDPMMWRSPIWRQVLALVSMLLGVSAMASLA